MEMNCIMPIDTTTAKYHNYHEAHTAWLLNNDITLDLKGARDMAHSILQAGLEITGLMSNDTDAQDSYDRLKAEQRIVDADLHNWQNPRQSSGEL